jgi:hypothetical protein
MGRCGEAAVHTLVGTVLVAGLVTFLVGAAGWRIEYEQPHASSLPLVHADRRRRWAWIHVWMVPALFLTPAGVAAVPLLLDDPVPTALGVVAAVTYGLGAVGWIATLLFRLTVTTWAAERTVEDGAVPATFPPLDAWMGSLHLLHMLSAHVAAVLLGTALLLDGGWPGWLGWGGVSFGVVSLAGFGSRVAFAFHPPFWAHVWTAALGVVLLTR